MSQKLYQNAKTVIFAIGLSAALAACGENTPKPTETAIVTEIPDEKEENAIDSFKRKGIILEQDENYEGYYRITKSSVTNNSAGGINDYFSEKGIVPVYDFKCSPEELAASLSNLDTGFDNFTYGDISLGSALSYNSNIDDSIGKKYKKMMFNIIYSDTNKYAIIPKEIIAYNLMNLKIEEVYDKEKHYSYFDSMKCCIYINRAYVNTIEEEKFALSYAIAEASLTAYVNIDGKRVYCGLTDFYYDSKNDKLLEVGKTYQDAVAYSYALRPSANNNMVSEDYSKRVYSMLLATGLLKFDYGNANINDFSRFVKMIVKGNNTQFQVESEVINIADLLLRVDAGDTDALKEVIDYYKLICQNFPQENRLSAYAAIRYCFFNSNVKPFMDELVEYATLKKTR